MSGKNLSKANSKMSNMQEKASVSDNSKASSRAVGGCRRDQNNSFLSAVCKRPLLLQKPCHCRCTAAFLTALRATLQHAAEQTINLARSKSHHSSCCSGEEIPEDEERSHLTGRAAVFSHSVLSHKSLQTQACVLPSL